MINKLNIIIILFCTLFLGCKKDVITSIDIRNQADLYYYCLNLDDSDTFIGNVLVSAEEELDYSCLDKIRHVRGTIFLEGPGSSRALKNIETIVTGEVFSVCDELADTMAFPHLRVIDNGLGFSMNSFCNFNNVLYLPNVEVLTGFSIGSISAEIECSGTVVGLNKVEETISIWIDIQNDHPDNLTIDGFKNLKRVLGEFAYNSFDEYLQISENSFNKLEEVGEFRLTGDPNSKANFSLEYVFPSLKSCSLMILNNFEYEVACYLKEHLASGDITLQVNSFSTGEFYWNERLLELCN